MLSQDPIDTVYFEPKYELIQEKSDNDCSTKELSDNFYWTPAAQVSGYVNTAQVEPTYDMIPDNNGSGATHGDEKIYHWYHY